MITMEWHGTKTATIFLTGPALYNIFYVLCFSDCENLLFNYFLYCKISL